MVLDFLFGEEQIDFIFVSVENIRIDPREDIGSQLEQIVRNLRFTFEEKFRSTFSQCTSCLEGMYSNKISAIFTTTMWVILISAVIYFLPYLKVLWAKGQKCSEKIINDMKNKTFYREPEPEKVPSTPKTPFSSTPGKRKSKKSPNSILREEL